MNIDKGAPNEADTGSAKARRLRRKRENHSPFATETKQQKTDGILA